MVITSKVKGQVRKYAQSCQGTALQKAELLLVALQQKHCRKSSLAAALFRDYGVC